MDKNNKMTIREYVSQMSGSLFKFIESGGAAIKDGSYQPQIAQNMMQDINSKIATATQEDIEEWLLNPFAHDSEFRQLSQYLEYSVEQYGRAIKYFSDSKAWYSEIVSVDGDPTLKSHASAAQYLRKYNYTFKFPSIDWDVSSNGISAQWIDENDKGIDFIPLPSEYVYLTGWWHYGFTAAIDLSYFDQLAYQENIIPELYNAYKHFVKMRELKGITPEQVFSSQFYPLPVDKSWVFTFSTKAASKLPPHTGSLSSALKIDSYRTILQQKTLLDIWKVVSLKIPVDDDDNLLVDTEEANDLMRMIFKMLPDGMQAFATPFDATPINSSQVQQANTLNDLGEQLFFRSMGVTSNLFGSAENKTATAMRLNMESDFNFFSHTYQQFENMLNFRYRIKYGSGGMAAPKYEFRFWGDKFKKEDDLKMQSQLVSNNNMMLFKLLAINGYRPYDIDGQLKLEKLLNLKERFEPMVTAFTSSGKDDGGSDKKDDGKLGESGEVNRDLDSNDDRK